MLLVSFVLTYKMTPLRRQGQMRTGWASQPLSVLSSHGLFGLPYDMVAPGQLDSLHDDSGILRAQNLNKYIISQFETDIELL